ncbi:Carbohydrate-binding family 9 [Paenibacillus sophorae]|uniref:Carbohydrate-binding family 9 n=1 Tax=Paenibacillus sophorae TaxID=1333845 RepID=A0A1H8M5E2_9BACL|nr:carbohydrate-binding family 9-like protein [Paenibacillus sophorae]QWU17678.1 hypothetical protein KP014_11385 [Paenibacillus sophorae]SEO12549.1 Carbohydrate-binding family 9 [Paenibacillus sophorae]
MNEARLYRVARNSGSTDWKDISPLAVDRYLWLDNGYTPKVEVRGYYTSERLHIQFKVFEQDPLVRYREQNDPVYTDSCVEFFMQPLPGSDPRYLNFEFNAGGTILLQMGETRENRITLADSPALFQIDTALNRVDEHSGDTYWELAFAIPFNWLQSRFPGFRAESGQAFRGNFYKCGDETPIPHYGCWNRVASASPDYHQSRFFGELVFE